MKSFKKLYPFFLILGFITLSVMDNGLPALFTPLSGELSLVEEKLLVFITSCAIGIVLGMGLISSLINKNNFKAFHLYVVLLIIGSCLISLVSPNFLSFNLARFLLGIATGTSASMAWWYSFNMSKNYSSYNTWIMACRPLSIALGVPVLFFLNESLEWKSAYGSLHLFVAILFCFSFYLLPKTIDNEPTPESEKKLGLLKAYKNIFVNPNSWLYYLGTFLNAMGYLGFFLILPFLETSISLKSIFFLMGIFEIVGTFLSRAVPLNSKFRNLAVQSILVFAPFILFALSSKDLILFIFPLYILAVRIFILDLSNSIPKIFHYLHNPNYFGFCGSLVGVFAWLGLGAISFILSNTLTSYGININYLILTFFNFLTVILIYVLKRRVY